MENIKLNNGLECPVIGIGTYMLSPEDAEIGIRIVKLIYCYALSFAAGIAEILK